MTDEQKIGAAHKGTVAKVALVIATVSIAVLTTYFVYPYTQPQEIVGVAVGKDEDRYTVSIYLLTNDRLNGVSANQLFDYTVEQDDIYWIQKGDIIVARIKGSKALVLSARSSPSDTPLRVYHERCGSADGGMCAVRILPLSLPRNFTVGRTWIGDFWTDHTHYFGLFMHPHDKIRFSFNSTEPLHFQFVFSNHITPEVHALANEAEHYGDILIEKPSTASYASEFTAKENGLYIFTFDIDPPKTSRVSFNGVRLWP